MAKWDLSKLPEGRKPLPDEWFAERAQMQERIKGLEDRLEEAVYLGCELAHCVEHGEMGERDIAGVDAWDDFIAELIGGKDE